MSTNGIRPLAEEDVAIEPVKPGEKPFSWGSLTERKVKTLAINGHEIKLMPLTLEESASIRLACKTPAGDNDEKKFVRLVFKTAVISPALTPSELMSLDKFPVDVINAVVNAAFTSVKVTELDNSPGESSPV